ncbi:MAG TPA: metallophosphoesterase [Puia sp.]|jgi:predicted MPP superfamily phosphohydrolase|nr:metallophosphoesterase [Puia sp.]
MHRGRFLTIFLILLALSLLFDVYAYNGLRTVASGWKSALFRKLFLYGYLAVSVGLMLLFVTGIGSLFTPQGMRPYHEWVLSLFLALLVTKLFFVLVLFLWDSGRFIYSVGNWLFGPRRQAGQPFMPARRQFMVDTALLVAAVPFGAFLYGMLKGKYDYRVHRQTLYFDDLPEAFDGFTITQISDIHSGSFDNHAAVQRGIRLAQAQKSDLFVFTGDLVNNVAWEIEPYLEDFSRLRAPFGQFSILGNHDYGDYIKWDSAEAKDANLEKLKAHHRTLGYRLLIDEHVILEKGGQQIVLLGVQNWGRGFIQLGDIDKALDGVDPAAFKILLSHDPTHWEEKIRYNPTMIHLTLAGHTHGAQFGVESDHLRWSPVQYRYLDWAGLANEKNRYLYVNRGFGFLAFSGRIGIWPEITVITLKKTV